MSFNIVTWNINGIRSIQQDLRKIFDTLNADIICLQETKITRKHHFMLSMSISNAIM